MDAVVTPTEGLRDYLSRMTDTPIRVIKDRFDIAEFPRPKKHTSKAKNAIWFGYAHNVDTLKFAIRTLERLNLGLVIISNEDPMAYRWANDKDYEKKYRFIKYEHPPFKDIQRGDICIFPEGKRPFDHFKSENKTVISELCGVPVVKNLEELEEMMDGKNRQEHIDKAHAILQKEYDCKKSIAEYKGLIDELKAKRRSN